MVKNTHGGSGHKKFARKHTSSASNNKLRISEDKGEIYGIVTKMLGNGMFHCHCIDGILRLGHIRGKFSGRGKRDNMVECNKWVLIGLREWDIPSEKPSISRGKEKEKIQHCDLVEIYSDTDKQRLREYVTEDWSQLDSHDMSKTVSGETSFASDDFIFGTDRDFERERLMEEMKSSTTEKITLKIKEEKEKVVVEEEEEINIDDI
jgi:initiation factor 1A